MAEKKTGMSYDQVMRNIKAGKFAPVYMLMGDEPYYIDMVCNAVMETALPPEDRDFNMSVLFGSEVTAAQVSDTARRFPMMAERMVVVVKEAQAIKNWEALDRYAANPPKTTVLVLCHKNGTVDRKKKANISMLAKIEAAGGVVLESVKKKDYELPSFVAGYVKSRKATIDEKAAQMLSDFVGADLSRLASEIDKLMIALSEDRRITPDIVEKGVGVSKEFNGFELRNAVVAKDVFKANQIIKYFDDNPKSGSIFAFLPLLFSFFQNLMIAHYAPNRNNENDVAAFLGLRGGWAARDYIAAMRHYNAVKTMNIISKMREIDAKSKGVDNPNTEVGELMKELIFFIMH